MKSFILIIITFCFVSAAFAQPNKILLVNGFLHQGNGQTQPAALVGIENGKITLIKNSLAYTYNEANWDTIINLNGKHIYPGFIAPNSTLGITEIDAVRATRDFQEVGMYNPHIRSQIAFNVESKVISTVRTNGVLLSQVTPRGGFISGTSSVMALDGWNWEDATVLANDGIHVNWPSSIEGKGWSREPVGKHKKYDERIRELKEFFALAETYANQSKPKEQDPRLEAMRDCFKESKRVYFHANELQQLLDVIEFSIAHNIKYPVIVGGYDAHLITRQLSDAKIPVMLIRTHSLPDNEEDDIDLPYKLPYLLQQGKVKFCLQNEGDMEAMNARNIPFLAGTAMAYGLSQEEAISAISLWSAEIMGIDTNYGSIEKGKSATLFVSDGNALDMKTNNVSLAMINGKFIDLVNSQKELYLKYSKKYRQQKKD